MTNYLMGLLHGWWLGFMLGAVIEAMRNDKKPNECPTDVAMKPEDYKQSA